MAPTPFSGACSCRLRVESRSVRIHERRTPITLIAGHAEGLLRRGPQAAAPRPTPTACSSASPPWWTTPCSTAMVW
jgi:hypothetical protein